MVTKKKKKKYIYIKEITKKTKQNKTQKIGKSENPVTNEKLHVVTTVTRPTLLCRGITNPATPHAAR